MEETLTNGVAAANGSGPAHDTGFSYAASAAVLGAAPCALKPEPPAMAELRAEIREIIAASPVLQAEDSSLLELMGLHDPGIASALTKLPEREGIGGATLALLVRKYRGVVDPYQTACEVASTLIFWPEPVPGDEALLEAALRLAEFNIDAARELARAHVFLGVRFALKTSVRVILEKYGIRADQLSTSSGLPVEGLTPAGAEAMLAAGQIDTLNELLRPYEIAIRQKIGTVNPVFSLVEKNNGRAVMPTRELIEFLRKRSVFA